MVTWVGSFIPWDGSLCMCVHCTVYTVQGQKPVRQDREKILFYQCYYFTAQREYTGYPVCMRCQHDESEKERGERERKREYPQRKGPEVEEAEDSNPEFSGL